jgi:hypothetical protein
MRRRPHQVRHSRVAFACGSRRDEKRSEAVSLTSLRPPFCPCAAPVGRPGHERRDGCPDDPGGRRARTSGEAVNARLGFLHVNARFQTSSGVLRLTDWSISRERGAGRGAVTNRRPQMPPPGSAPCSRAVQAGGVGSVDGCKRAARDVHADEVAVVHVLAQLPLLLVADPGRVCEQAADRAAVKDHEDRIAGVSGGDVFECCDNALAHCFVRLAADAWRAARCPPPFQILRKPLLDLRRRQSFPAAEGQLA